MSARDELAELLVNVPWRARPADQVADAILAAGYTKSRTITTVEELDALPVGSWVFWAEEAWKRVKPGTSGWQDFHGATWTLIVTESEPATVLHEPTA